MRARHVISILLIASGTALAQPEAEPAPEQDKPAAEPAKTTVTVSGTIEAPDLDAPLAGATVTVVGTKITATSDDEGKFTLELDPGTYKLRADFAGFKSDERSLTVTAETPATLAFQLATQFATEETIIVVGSRTPRTNADTTVPVDIVTAEVIGRSGRTETGRILHTLAASYISTPQTIADGSDHVDPASLRGLGPDQVLILINGKRRHRSALLHLNGTFGRGTVGTDLNAIPVGSIKRIEILRDGAASQYGSDAIAGVINIVTKDVTDLLEINAETGITASRDGAQVKTSANYGFKLGSKGFLNLTGEFLRRTPTNRTGEYSGTIYSDDPAVDAQVLADRGLTRDDFEMKIGESSATSGSGAYNMELPVSEVAKFYSFGDIAHRRSRAAGFFRFPKQETQTVGQFYPDGFLPRIEPTIDDAAITVGVRRKGKWTVDASLTHGRNAFKFNIENSVNASLDTASPTTFDAGTLEFAQSVANLDLVRKLETDLVKSLSFVVGSELRVENFKITRGDDASFADGMALTGDGDPKVPGAQVFPGFQPSNEVDRTRDSVGIYAGFESALSNKVSVDIGGRFEQYSDFGRSLIGKVAARAKLGGPLSIRGAASTGFRAPSLHQLWFSNISTQFVDIGGVLTPAQVLTSNNESPVTRAFGIPRLREERSINASAGFVVRHGESLSLTVDGYFIRLLDRIVLTSQFDREKNMIVDQILTPFPAVTQAQFFANAVDTDTAGLDVVVDYQTDVGPGSLTLTGSANVTKTSVTRINTPDDLEKLFGSDPGQLETFFFGRLARNRLEDSVPRQKGTFAARYAVSKLSLLGRANYYGAVDFKPDNPDNDEHFGAKVLFDVDVGYQFTKNVLFRIGADNLLNTFPDRQTKDANISSGRLIYSRNVSQFGQNGGFYYGKLELTFF